MSSYISCAQYDYFEIACMQHYEVRLTLIDGEIVQGIASNLKIVNVNGKREEVLELLINTKIQEVALSNIKKMEAANENPHFATIFMF